MPGPGSHKHGRKERVVLAEDLISQIDNAASCVPMIAYSLEEDGNNPDAWNAIANELIGDRGACAEARDLVQVRR